MKAKVTGVSAWQGVPVSGTLDIKIQQRYVDSDGNATVAHYSGVLRTDGSGPRWVNAQNPNEDLWTVVQGPLDPTGPLATFHEIVSYGPESDVRTTFTRRLVSSDLSGLLFDYAQPAPVNPAGFGAEPLTMTAARQLLGFVPQLEQATDEFEAVLQELADSKADLEQSAAANKAATDNAIAAVYLAQSATLTGSVASYADLPTDATPGQAYMVRGSLQVYVKNTDDWAYQYRLAAPTIAPTIARTADLKVDKLRAAQFTLTTRTTINRVRVYVAARHTDAETTTSGTNLMRVRVYNSAGVQVIEGPLTEIPEPGEVELPVPSTTLESGTYYATVNTNNLTTAKFGRNDFAGGVEMTQAWPAPATLSLATPTASVPALTLLPADPPRLAGGGQKFAATAICYGLGIPSGLPYGFKQSGSKLARSTDGGATWSDICPWPTFDAGDSAIDVLVYETTYQAVLLTNKGKIYLKNDTRIQANDWEDFTPPQKHINAVGRPYGVEIMTATIGGPPYLFYSEYSGAPNEIDGSSDGRWPAVHRANLQTKTWVVSGFFPGTRHMHSLKGKPNNILRVSAGDTLLPNGTTATGTGLWRLPASGIGVPANGGADTWTKETGTTADGYSGDRYMVDFIELAATAKRPGGIYGASDRPGSHLLHVKTGGKVGRLNINIRCYGLNGSLTETVRSIAEDPATGNIYYFTAETTAPGFYVSPPPHTQTLKLYSYPANINLNRLVISNNYAIQHIQRFKLATLEG